MGESTSSQSTGGPVGSGDYVVAAGESVISIAAKTGHFWKKLWDLPENAELKRVRKDPNILYPGDRLTVPEIKPRDESVAPSKRHTYKRKGVPAILRVVCLNLDEPLANQPYRLDIDGKLTTGNTDGDGLVEVPVPPGAREGVLLVGTEPETFRFDLAFGHVNPIDTVSGVKARLNNLGFAAGAPDDEEVTDALKIAVRNFQEKYDLKVTGELDQATRDKLVELTR